MNRRQRRAHANRSRVHRDVALDRLIAQLDQGDVDQQARVTVVEIAKGMGELARSQMLGLTEEQKAIADRGTVAYCTWWLEQRGLDVHGRRVGAENRSVPEG